MTTDPQPQMLPPTIRIDSPTALIAVTPPLLGRNPLHEVVIWSGLADGASSLPNLSTRHLDDLDCDGVINNLVGDIVAGQPRQVMIVAWETAADEANLIDLAGSRIVGELIWRCTESGIVVVQAVTTNGRVWWSHICPGGEPGHTCDGTSTRLDSSIALAVRAELVAAGYPLPGHLPAPAAPEFKAAVAAALSSLQEPPESLESWRDQEISWLTALWRRHSAPGGGPTCTAASIARALRALADIRVRDTVMFRMGLWGPRPSAGVSSLAPLLEQLVGASPDPVLPAAATLLALLRWLDGCPGAARDVLDQALEVDPGYNLARLTMLLIDSELSPQAWRSGLLGLSERECRTGRQDPRNRRRRAMRVVHLRRIAG